jgi:uncharacterized membrane protein
MTQYDNPSNLSVDRHEETVVTQQPGYSATEQIVHDRAAERRMGLYQVSRIVWTVLGIMEILFAIRFVLKLIAANPNSGFAQFIYGITGPFLAPFAGLTATPSSSGVVLEITTLIAMVIYALFVWIVLAVLQVLTDRPTARYVSRSVRENAPVVTTGPVVTTTVPPSTTVVQQPGTTTTQVERTTVSH